LVRVMVVRNQLDFVNGNEAIYIRRIYVTNRYLLAYDCLLKYTRKWTLP
jgi:hypothetical protein